MALFDFVLEAPICDRKGMICWWGVRSKARIRARVSLSVTLPAKNSSGHFRKVNTGEIIRAVSRRFVTDSDEFPTRAV